MTRKILRQIVCAIVLFMVFLPIQLKADDVAAPTPIFGGDSTGTTDTQTGVNNLKTALGNSGVTKIDSVSELIVAYVNFALPYLALAAFLGFVYAGFLYVTAYGAEEQITKAKKIMIYAVVGLIVVILSYGIVQLLTVELVKNITPKVTP